MGPGFPAVGSQARRKVDGILGEVYLTDPPQNLLFVRWSSSPGGFTTEECTVEQFARSWELTGAVIPPARETKVALGLISALVLLLFVVVLVHDSRSNYRGYDSYRPLAVESPSLVNNAQALDERYGLLAAEKCSDGVDDYIRSVTHHRFHWTQTDTLTPRFASFRHAVSAPGVLTLYSTQASVSDGFGNFHPITVDCNYDTESREVLSYSADGVEQ
jgi:hypothetical protein